MDNPKPSIPPLTRRTYAMVLAGGRGSRLKELTDRRAKPAVFFGAKTRIVDFALSNVWNSHPPHGRCDPVQGPLAYPAPATRLELHPHRAQRVFRYSPASQRMDQPHWYKGPPMRSFRTWILSTLTSPNTYSCSPVTISTKWITG